VTVSDAATADGGSPALGDYQHYPHQQLYDWLTASDPGQVHGLHAGWLGMADDAASLGRQLARDLGRLQWDGAAGDEYRNRVGAIGAFAASLGQGFEPIADAVFVMAGDLSSARAEAVAPGLTSPADQLSLGLPQLTLLPQVAKDHKAEQAGHAKMVQLVTSLAEAYQTTSYGRIVPPAEPPAALPTHSNGAAPTDGSGPVGGYQATAARYGTGNSTSTLTGGGYTAPGQPPTLSYSDASQMGTALAGIGPAAGLTGAGVTALPAATGPAGGYGGTGLVAAVGMPGAGSTELGAGPRRPGMTAGGREPAELASRPGAGAAGRGRDDGDELAEHTTWLTDDLMVWADPLDLPPAVLGERPPTT
jgi:hypothetical protein